MIEEDNPAPSPQRGHIAPTETHPLISGAVIVADVLYSLPGDHCHLPPHSTTPSYEVLSPPQNTSTRFMRRLVIAGAPACCGRPAAGQGQGVDRAQAVHGMGGSQETENTGH